MQIKRPDEITAATEGMAINKIATPRLRLIVQSVLAGAYIALGGALSVVAGFGMPEATAANPGLQRLLSGATFPIGLILVVALGAELFTGNNATLVPAYMRGRIKASGIALNWSIVWLGNFAGALTFCGLFVAAGGILDAGPYSAALAAVAEAKVSMPWLTVMVKGIGANWCVCLAIWLALSGHTLIEKMAGCWLPVMAFVALGFEHSIANMFFLPAAMMTGADISVSAMLADNLIAATVGNIIGGALFVGMVYGWLHNNKKTEN